MLQDPNVERVIKNYTEPLQKQISMIQIELEALKQQCNIGAVSGSLLMEVKTLLEQYRDEEMPNWNTPYHYEAEGWASMKYFMRWLERKSNDR